MKLYNYFISYHYEAADDRGFGWMTLPLRRLIAQKEDILNMTDYLKKQTGAEWVVVLNFILLGEQEFAADD